LGKALPNRGNEDAGLVGKNGCKVFAFNTLKKGQKGKNIAIPSWDVVCGNDG
jgi:hypothetical protein